MGKSGKKIALSLSCGQISTECSRAWDRCRRLGTYLGYLYARFQSFAHLRWAHNSAVERNFYPILDCKAVLELSVNALEGVRFSFAFCQSRRRTHAPTADRYPPKMGVASIFWIWLILILDVVWRLFIIFKRLNVQKGVSPTQLIDIHQKWGRPRFSEFG